MRADAVERRTLPGKRSAEANYAGGSGTMQLAGIEGQLGTPGAGNVVLRYYTRQ